MLPGPLDSSAFLLPCSPSRCHGHRFRPRAAPRRVQPNPRLSRVTIGWRDHVMLTGMLIYGNRSTPLLPRLCPSSQQSARRRAEGAGWGAAPGRERPGGGGARTRPQVTGGRVRAGAGSWRTGSARRDSGHGAAGLTLWAPSCHGGAGPRWPGRAARGGALPWASAGRRRAAWPGSGGVGPARGPSSPGRRNERLRCAWGGDPAAAGAAGQLRGRDLREAAGNRLQYRHSRGFSGGLSPSRPEACASAARGLARPVSPLRVQRSARRPRGRPDFGPHLRNCGLTAQRPTLLTQSQAGAPCGTKARLVLRGH